MLSLPAQPRPNNAVDPAARRAFALSSTRPTLRLTGARKEAKPTGARPVEPRVRPR